MMSDVTRVPIACSLTELDARDRIEEWRTFLADHVDAASRPHGGLLRLRLGSDDESLIDAVDLASRERACCGFFSFAIDIESDSRWLRITVPAEANAVLDDFAQLLPSGLTT